MAADIAAADCQLARIQKNDALYCGRVCGGAPSGYALWRRDRHFGGPLLSCFADHGRYLRFYHKSRIFIFDQSKIAPTRIPVTSEPVQR